MFIGIGLDITRGSGGGSFLSGATLDMNFATGAYLGAGPANLTVTRSGTNATDLTYDQTSRTSYNSFAANAARIVADGRGLLVEESRTQYLGVTDSPATQTTASLGTGTYTCWCIGGTSVAIAGTTATITGAGSATPGTPLTFTVTVAGTVTATVTGAVRYFQLENGAFATSYIPNAGAAGTTSTRSADLVQITGSIFTALYNTTASTMYGRFSLPGLDTTKNHGLLSLDNGTNNNRFQCYVGTGSFPAVVASRYSTGGVATNPANITTSVTANQTLEVAATVSVAAGAAVSANGSAVQTASPAALPVGPDRFNIGNITNGTQMSGFVQRFAYLPTRVSDANLPLLRT